MTRCLALVALVIALALPARANPYADLVELDVLPGWRMADGTHMIAVRLRMKDGWKTYWRAPGDAGIPPVFDWAGSRNLRGVRPEWPAPIVFEQSGMTSIGYDGELILPLNVTPRTQGQPVDLVARLQVGICKDICVPVELDFAVTAGVGARPDAAIVGALADRPISAAMAGVREVTCAISASRNGLALEARIVMPGAAAVEAVAVETADPQVWVAEPALSREGEALVARTELMHVGGGAFALDRGGLRMTLLGGGRAVDIQGCPAP